MHPGNGTWRLEATTGEIMTMVVSGGSATVTFGTLAWDATEDWFRHPKADVIIRFLTAYVAGPPEVLGTFAAVVKQGTPQEQTYGGTYGPA